MKNIVFIVFTVIISQIIILCSSFFLSTKNNYKNININESKALSTENFASYFPVKEEENKQMVEEKKPVEEEKTPIKEEIKEEIKETIKPVVPPVDKPQEEPKEEIIASYVSGLTAYTADCKDCSGKVGCAPYQDVRGGNIYYNDNKYGKIRIVAADKSIPCGSIVKVEKNNFFENDLVAIVLDRGGNVSFAKNIGFDLLYDDFELVRTFGIKKEIKFNILRWGW